MRPCSREQISGYLRVRFEDIAIYLSKDDAQYGMTRNGFWVSFDETKIPFEKGTKGPIQYDGKYVLIEGTFDKNARGHKKLWSGTIKNVNRVIQLRRTEQREEKAKKSGPDSLIENGWGKKTAGNLSLTPSECNRPRRA